MWGDAPPKIANGVVEGRREVRGMGDRVTDVLGNARWVDLCGLAGLAYDMG